MSSRSPALGEETRQRDPCHDEVHEEAANAGWSQALFRVRPERDIRLPSARRPRGTAACPKDDAKEADAGDDLECSALAQAPAGLHARAEVRPNCWTTSRITTTANLVEGDRARVAPSEG